MELRITVFCVKLEGVEHRRRRVDDVVLLVERLTPQERVRLLRLIAASPGGGSAVYRAVPPGKDEFSSDEEPLAWDAEGWEVM